MKIYVCSVSLFFLTTLAVAQYQFRDKNNNVIAVLDSSGNSNAKATSVMSGAVDFSTITIALATKLDNSQIPNLSTVTVALATKLTNSQIPDLSTVTIALATKLTNSQIPDFSTITVALATKLTNSQIPDLSTVTTALAGKLSNTVTIPGYLVDHSTGQASLNAGVAVSVSTITVFGGVLYSNRTKAQLNAITPIVQGESYYCSDCSPKKVVVSTGTGARNFADFVGGTFK